MPQWRALSVLVLFITARKFAKVMYFTRVCLSTGGSTWAGPPRAGTPPVTVHAGIRSTSGMHSCFNWFLVFSVIRLLKIWYEAQ